MSGLSKKRCASFCRCVLLLAMVLGMVTVAAATMPLVDDPELLLQQANKISSSNHVEFVRLLKKLNAPTLRLNRTQRVQLDYLNAWNAGYEGYNDKAIALLEGVIAESNDINLRFRAGLSVVVTLSEELRYEEAFTRLSQLLSQLSLITDKEARSKGLVEASQLYEDAGQYELSLSYSDLLMKESPVDGDYACKAGYMRSAALYKSAKWEGIESQFEQSIQRCLRAGNNFYADGIRLYVASLDVKKRNTARAIMLLQKNYPDVRRSAFPILSAGYEALLSQAYWDQRNYQLASQFALAAIGTMSKNDFAEPLTDAYRLLYLIARQKGDIPEALAYHEKYMAADKGYLNELSTKALAYQMVKQQVLAKKLQIDTLNKQNRILQLQQTLSAKAMETTRLYVALLLTILASIAFWAYRVKRSQLRFMKMARRDGLTGIFNRQHFVAAAERQLQYCEKSARVASLIVIDLDHFKIVNDTHGHAAGDHVLCRAAAACQAHLRSTDVFGRLGGEEFGILMPECDGQRTASRAELIRVAISSVSDSEETQGILVSASFGVASTTHSSYNLRQLLIHADKALYSAKREGRNRVVLFDGDGDGQVDVATLTHQSLQRR
jgi:diguanylate cyclase (GGDEF)-like protein